jgi:hypothetical protein
VQGTEPGVYLTTLDRPGAKKFLFNAASDATYVPGQRYSPGYLLWVARDTVMAQPFDPQSAQLIGSVVAVPGTGGVASSVATQRTSVSVSSDGTLLYSTGGSRYQLGWFGRDGALRGTVGAIEQYIGLRLSPDGREVLVTIRDATANGDLWRIDLSSGARSRITSEGGGWYGVWSPDSQRVAFTALTQRKVLQTVTARGGGEVQNVLTFDDLEVFPSDWSFEGQYLASTAVTQNTAFDVWLLPMMGAPKPVPLLRSSFVYVQSFPDAATRQIVSNTGGAYPRWSPGGRELFYRALDGHLMTVPVRLVGSSVELGAPSVVMRLVEAAGVHPYPYDLAADGRILAMTPASGDVQDVTLTVLMNWQAALRP